MGRSIFQVKRERQNKIKIDCKITIIQLVYLHVSLWLLKTLGHKIIDLIVIKRETIRFFYTKYLKTF